MEFLLESGQPIFLQFSRQRTNEFSRSAFLDEGLAKPFNGFIQFQVALFQFQCHEFFSPLMQGFGTAFAIQLSADNCCLFSPSLDVLWGPFT